MLDLALAAGNTEAASTALRAQALAWREQGRIDDARRSLEEAIEVASAGSEMRAGGLARGSLASVLMASGDADGALAQLDVAIAVLSGRDAAAAAMQRGAVLQRLGRVHDALTSFELALAGAVECGDEVTEARTRANRGVLQGYAGKFAAATRDLEVAERLFRRNDMELFAVDCEHNLGFVSARSGDVLKALRLFTTARAAYDRLDVGRPNARLDECEALIAVRLAPEARRAATEAERELRAGGQLADAAEAGLLRARACEIAGDFEEAAAAAAMAEEAFRAQGRPPWSALARAAKVRADVHRGRPPDPAIALEVALELVLQGWAVEGAEAAVLAAHVAVAAGDLAVASRALEAGATSRSHRLARARVAGWHAFALQRAGEGDGAGARRAARRALVAAAQAAAAFGATDLRTSSSGSASEVAELGIELAMVDARPATVFAWAELWRANAVSLPHARPPADPELATDLAELRHLASRLRDDTLAGHAIADATQHQSVLEHKVARRARLVPGYHGLTPERPVRPPQLRDVRSRLGAAVLLELIEHAGQLSVLTIDSRRASVRRLGPLAPVADDVATLRFGLARVLSPRTRPASRDAVRASAAAAAARLSSTILASVPDRARPLVIVPTGALHALPWAALPGCRDRPVTVVPSTKAWLRAAAVEPAGDGVALVAGPGLAGAQAEIAALCARYPGAEALTASRASVARVSEALERADVAHIAAHGHFRSDNPMFSSLALADGALTVYDLEAMVRLPRLVVLSACDVGRSEVRPGNEVLGVVSAFLSSGTSTLVASVLPVPDEVAAATSVAFHDRVLAGDTAATALASAQSGLHGQAPFVCFGAG